MTGPHPSDRLVAELVHTARAVAWSPMAVAVAAGATLVLTLGRGSSTQPLQLSAFLLGASVSFVLDDPAAEVLAASPRTRWARRVTRLALALPAVGVAWALALVADPPAHLDESITLTVVLFGSVGLCLGVGAVARRARAGASAGAVAAPVFFLLLVLSSAMPPDLRPLPTGDVPGGLPAISARWGGAGLVGFVLLRVASRDLPRTGRWSRRP